MSEPQQIEKKMAEIHLEESKAIQKHQDHGIKKFDSFTELLEKHQHIVLAKKEQDWALKEDKETKVPKLNIKFIEAFDNFSSFPKAADFIQDWVKTKKENSNDL